ncbi:universal stress protein [Streptomyces sp. NPDC008122]|uniref:universal stress protein n=1 Tax=Streptomyces sp. NPDC008122 TaxID=3364810 RepID=UPI0036F160D8
MLSGEPSRPTTTWAVMGASLRGADASGVQRPARPARAGRADRVGQGPNGPFWVFPGGAGVRVPPSRSDGGQGIQHTGTGRGTHRRRGLPGTIVMGDRGLGGVGALMLGSVGRGVAAHTGVPVLVVRGDGDRPETGMVTAAVHGASDLSRCPSRRPRPARPR